MSTDPDHRCLICDEPVAPPLDLDSLEESETLICHSCSEDLPAAIGELSDEEQERVSKALRRWEKLNPGKTLQ